MLLHITNAACIFVGQGNAMHAQVYPAHSDRFKEMVREGRVYNFCYFRIKNVGSYRPVPNDLMATFSTWTTIEEVAEIPPAFPEYVYTLASMQEIQSRVDSIAIFTGECLFFCIFSMDCFLFRIFIVLSFTIDVIGVITSISKADSIQTRMKQGETLRRTVMIREQRYI
jgi:replication factor A1